MPLGHATLDRMVQSYRERLAEYFGKSELEVHDHVRDMLRCPASDLLADTPIQHS